MNNFDWHSDRITAETPVTSTYVERHRSEPRRARIAGAILRPGGGIEWLHLQETPAPQLDKERKRGAN